MQSVLELPGFQASAKKAGMTDMEREAVIDHLARNPKAGVLIPGTGGARKLRWRAEGRGKSGGYRVITYWAGDRLPVFLMDVYSKTARADLSAAGRSTLKTIIAGLAETYSEGKRK